MILDTTTDDRLIQAALAFGRDRLKSVGIKTTADLDGYMERKGLNCSRYRALVKICGDDAALWIMHELAARECALD